MAPADRRPPAGHRAAKPARLRGGGLSLSIELARNRAQSIELALSIEPALSIELARDGAWRGRIIPARRPTERNRRSAAPLGEVRVPPPRRLPPVEPHELITLEEALPQVTRSLPSVVRHARPAAVGQTNKKRRLLRTQRSFSAVSRVRRRRARYPPATAAASLGAHRRRDATDGLCGRSFVRLSLSRRPRHGRRRDDRRFVWSVVRPALSPRTRTCAQWARAAFPPHIKALNRLQSAVFESAFHTSEVIRDDMAHSDCLFQPPRRELDTFVFHASENLLVCAPTGAGKTNVAMLALLQYVSTHVRDGVLEVSRTWSHVSMSYLCHIYVILRDGVLEVSHA